MDGGEGVVRQPVHQNQQGEMPGKDAEMADQQTDETQDEGEGGGTPPPSFDEWLGQQDEIVKGLVETHTKGLKSALDKERDDRKTFERELRAAQGKLKKDSDEWKALEDLASKSEGESRRANAYETLHAAGVSNLKAAYTLAAADDLFDRRGNVDVEALRKTYPELFATTQRTAGNAGSGAGQGKQQTPGMNDMIRRAAGR